MILLLRVQKCYKIGSRQHYVKIVKAFMVINLRLNS
jgi:hypothetical protein